MGEGLLGKVVNSWILSTAVFTGTGTDATQRSADDQNIFCILKTDTNGRTIRSVFIHFPSGLYFPIPFLVREGRALLLCD